MGASILISGSAIEPLLAAAQTIPFLPFDDVYLTGLCSSKAGVQLFASDRFKLQTIVIQMKIIL